MWESNGITNLPRTVMATQFYISLPNKSAVSAFLWTSGNVAVIPKVHKIALNAHVRCNILSTPTQTVQNNNTFELIISKR